MTEFMKKRTYIAPTMTCIRVTPMQIIAGSIDKDDINITNADDYEILGREDHGVNVPNLWDDKW